MTTRAPLELLLPEDTPIASARAELDPSQHPFVAMIARGSTASPPGWIEDARYILLPRASAPRFVLPAEPLPALLGAIALLRPGSRKGRVLRRLLLESARRGVLPLSSATLRILRRPDAEPRPPRVAPLLRDALADDRPVVLSLARGTPSPFAKSSLRALDPSTGDTLLHAKIAMTTSRGAERIAHEAAVLERIGRLDGLAAAARVPRILARTNLGAWTALGLEALPRGRGEPPSERDLAAIHVAIHRQTAAPGALLEGALFRWIEQQPKPTGALSTAYDLCRDRLSSLSLPLGLAHRDLASWNVLPGAPHGVVDWELAIDGAPPLFDLFHALVFEPLLLTRTSPERAVDRMLSEPAGELLRSCLRSTGATRVPVAAILALYLLDRSLLLHEEQADVPTSERTEQLERLERALTHTIGG